MLRLPVLIVLSFLSFQLQAQLYKLRHYTVADGLPSSQIYWIEQDSKGYVWMATEEGVCRFDGYQFKTYTTKDGLPDNDVLWLTEDRQGRMWFISFRKPPSYIENGKIQVFNPDSIFNNVLVSGVAQDEQGRLWFSTNAHGVIRYDKGKIAQFNSRNIFPFDLAYAYTARKNEVWISTVRRLGKFENEKVKFYDIPTESDFTRDVVKIHFIGERIFAFTREVVFEFKNGTFRRIFGSDAYEKELNIYEVTDDKRGNILIATTKGAYSIPIDSGKVTLLFNSPVNRMIGDREGNIWFSTLNDGLYMLTASAARIKNYTHVDGQSLGQLNGFFQDGDRLYFFNRSNDVFYQENDTLHTVPFLDKNLLSNIRSCFRMNGQLYCGSDKGVLIPDNLNFGNIRYTNQFFDWSEKAVTNRDTGIQVNKATNFFPLGSVKSMLPDGKGNILLGSDGGLFKIEFLPASEGYRVVQYDARRITSLIMNTDGALWIGRTDGIDIFRNGKMTNSGLKVNGPVKALRVSSSGKVWVATGGSGLYIIGDTIEAHFTSSDGLSGDLLMNLLEVENGFLVGGTKGVNMVEYTGKGNYNIYPLSINDGLQAVEVNAMTIFKGKLYLGTNKGLSIADKKHIKPDSDFPPVYLTRISIEGRDTAFSASYTLPYDRNNIQLEYVGISFKSNKDILYRYKMEGIDSSWLETRFTNLQYPALAPGKYRFLVDARNLQGNWSGKPVVLEFIISPPFWQTLWFRLLIGGSLLLIVVGVAYAIVRYYRNKNELARKMVLLEGQALRAQMNPHFIFNSLNAIHDFIANQDERSAHIYLARFAALIRKILEFSRKHSISLSDEIEALKLYVDLENMRFTNKFEYSFKVEVQSNAFDIMVPPMLIQPYIENSIRHGLVSRQGMGQLTVEIKQVRNILHCNITDNGIGRKRASEMGGKNLKAHRSMGMDITNRRIQMHNSKGKEMKAEVIIHDLEDGQGNGIGTRVELLIPLE